MVVDYMDYEDIIWHCYECDSQNSGYEGENTFCIVCDERISKDEENRCLYEFADSLFKNAASSDDFIVACEHFSKVQDYKDAGIKILTCQMRASEIKANEEAYKKALRLFKLALEYETEDLDEAEKRFSEAGQEFEKLADFRDSKTNAKLCYEKKELCENKKIFFKAKEMLNSAKTIEDYQKVADLFSRITKFTDAKIEYDNCIKIINRLKAEQQYEELLQQSRSVAEESDLDKKIAILQKIMNYENVVLSDDAKKIISDNKPLLEDCLKQKKAIETRQDLDIATQKYNKATLITDHTARINAFTKIVGDYRAYATTSDFSPIFAQCDAGITEAKKNIAYEKALSMMNNATDFNSYKRAAEAFAVLSFKDSEKKKEECLEKADLTVKEKAYNAAFETFEKGRQINIFNWMKYK